MKSAFILLVGRPSTGKSTLLNALLQRKVSITSSVPQTTRNKVRGILTEERGQLVFLDTPGFHKSERRMNLKLVAVLSEAIEEADVAVYLVDPTRPIGDEEATLAKLVKDSGKPIIVAISKKDLAPAQAAHADSARAFLAENGLGGDILALSGYDGEGLEELKNRLFAAAPDGEPYYPGEYYTDQEPRFRASELIREKIVRGTMEEVPHCVFVEIEDMEMRSGEKECLWIRAVAYVDRESQKGIIVGKGGVKIKAIGAAARQDLEQAFETKVYLDLRVKVKTGWRTDENLLNRLIY